MKTFTTAALMGATLITASASAFAQKRPNVIVILTDDQGWGDFSGNGNTILQTPNIDALMERAGRFDRFYVSPLSAPTRASLLTGRYHPAVGSVGVTGGWEYLNPGAKTFAELFHAAGYRTGCFGKWHNGSNYPQTPNGKGFDEFVGFHGGNLHRYFHSRLERNGVPFETDGVYITDFLTDEALKFIERNRNNEFLAYIPYNAPHGPYIVPDKYYDKYLPLVRAMETRYDVEDEALAAIYGMCENIDDNVGRLVTKLKELGIYHNTIIVFMTDNGPVTDRWNDNMKGRKSSVHEGGVRTNAFICWDGKIRPALYGGLAAHIDILPTISELCGVDYSKVEDLDGISLVPLLMGKTSALPERTIYTHIRGLFVETNGAARTSQYRFTIEQGKPGISLADMKADPEQKVNLAETKPEVMQRLYDDYKRWFEKVWQGTDSLRYIPIGYREAPTAHLFGCEAKLYGGFKYSVAGFTGDWITNFSSSANYACWDIDAARGGKYEIGIQYACPNQGTGTQFILEFGKKKIPVRIEKEYVGDFLDENRRVLLRFDNYDRNWGYQKIGVIELPKGKQRVGIRTVSAPEGNGLDVFAVVVKLL